MPNLNNYIMTIIKLFLAFLKSLNAKLKGNTITLFDMDSLIKFLTILDDSKMSFTFSSLIYSKVEDGISSKYDHEGNIIEKKRNDITSDEKMSGNVLKVAYAPIQTVTSYGQKIINKLAKKGIIIKVEDIKFKQSHWAKRHKNSILGYSVKDDNKTVKYLAYYPNGKPYNKKFYNRITENLVNGEDLKKYYNPSKLKKYGSSTQYNVGLNVDEHITPQILKLTNLREFVINGIKIKFRPELRTI